MRTAQGELLGLAKARAKDDQIPFSEALIKVARERPSLASEARAEVVKSTTTYEAPPEKEKITLGAAQIEFIQLANERAKRDGITLSEAIRSVARDRPLLAVAYREEVIKSSF